MKGLIHVGFTNSVQIDYAKEDQGYFYSNSEDGCNIPLYMLNAHSLRALNSEVINTHEAMQARIDELEDALKGFNLLIDSVKNEQLENWFDALSNHSDHCREALEKTA